MISAIAARKAAQATRQQQEQQPSEPHSSSVAPLPLPKRKSSAQHTKSTAKKLKRDGKLQTQSPTPSLNVLKVQPDVIVISDDDGDERMNSSSSEASGVEPVSRQSTQVAQRPWTPSLPVHDLQSDDDVVLDAFDLIDTPAGVPRHPEAKTGTTLSTFSSVSGQNTFFLSADETNEISTRVRGMGTMIILEEGETLCLLGTCQLTLLKGSVTVNGVPLRPSLVVHNIFAPRSSPLPLIECCTCSNTDTVIVDASCLPERMRPFHTSRSAFILLQASFSEVEGLGRVCPAFEGVYTPSDLQPGSISSPFQNNRLYLVNRQTQETVPFTLPTSWGTALTSVSTHLSSPTSADRLNPVFLVKGPKKSGKSTFARNLLNALLFHYKRAAFLECDIGQSEFTPGGLVSLNVLDKPVFGPPYTHLSLPLRAHFIGATTPRTSPNEYLDGVRDLIDTWKLDVMHTAVTGVEVGDERVSDMIPLVINTMGWSKGLGADLMERIEEMAEPGWVFDFKLDEDDLSYSGFYDSPTQHSTQKTRNTFSLKPVPPSVLSTNYSAADHRNLSILSYLYSVLPPLFPPSTYGPNFNPVVVQSWDTTLPLFAIWPYEVNIRVAFDRIILRGAGSEDVVPEELGRVLNGAVVGFVRPDDPNNLTETSTPRNDLSKIPYSQGQPPPSPSESSCVGLGLIRAVSLPSHSNLPQPSSTTDSPAILHILTPIPAIVLTSARILVKGEMELPILGMLDFRDPEGGVAGVEKSRVRYLQWGRGSEDAIGAEKRRIRRNLMRKGQA